MTITKMNEDDYIMRQMTISINNVYLIEPDLYITILKEGQLKRYEFTRVTIFFIVFTCTMTNLNTPYRTPISIRTVSLP